MLWFVRRSFCESRDGVRLPRDRGRPPAKFGELPGKSRELPGKSGKLPGKSRELPGKSGKLPGNLWIAAKFHSEMTSGEVARKLLGKFGEPPGKSRDFPEARGSLTPSQQLAKCVSKQTLGCLAAWAAIMEWWRMEWPFCRVRRIFIRIIEFFRWGPRRADNFTSLFQKVLQTLYSKRQRHPFSP